MPSEGVRDKIARYRDFLANALGKVDDQQVLVILEKLDKLPISLDHLQETGIGKIVNGYRKCSNPVGMKAKAIVNKWKGLVQAAIAEESCQKSNPSPEQMNVDGDQSVLSSSVKDRTTRHGEIESAYVQKLPVNKVHDSHDLNLTKGKRKTDNEKEEEPAKKLCKDYSGFDKHPSSKSSQNNTRTDRHLNISKGKSDTEGSEPSSESHYDAAQRTSKSSHKDAGKRTSGQTSSHKDYKDDFDSSMKNKILHSKDHKSSKHSPSDKATASSSGLKGKQTAADNSMEGTERLVSDTSQKGTVRDKKSSEERKDSVKETSDKSKTVLSDQYLSSSRSSKSETSSVKHRSSLSADKSETSSLFKRSSGSDKSRTSRNDLSNSKSSSKNGLTGDVRRKESSEKQPSASKYSSQTDLNSGNCSGKESPSNHVSTKDWNRNKMELTVDNNDANKARNKPGSSSSSDRSHSSGRIENHVKNSLTNDSVVSSDEENGGKSFEELLNYETDKRMPDVRHLDGHKSDSLHRGVNESHGKKESSRKDHSKDKSKVSHSQKERPSNERRSHQKEEAHVSKTGHASQPHGKSQGEGKRDGRSSGQEYRMETVSSSSSRSAEKAQQKSSDVPERKSRQKESNASISSHGRKLAESVREVTFADSDSEADDDGNGGMSFEACLNYDTKKPSSKRSGAMTLAGNKDKLQTKAAETKSDRHDASGLEQSLINLPLPKQVDLELDQEDLPMYPSMRQDLLTKQKADDKVANLERRYGQKMIYSGKKQAAVPLAMTSLFDACMQVLQENIDSITYVGGFPADILMPVLKQCSVAQLEHLEYYNPQFVADTDELWKIHCNRDFRGHDTEELESWRELYMRMQDEREEKLALISKSVMANKKRAENNVSKIQLTYVDNDPRNRSRKQRPVTNFSTATGFNEETGQSRSKQEILDSFKNQIAKPIPRRRGWGGGSGAVLNANRNELKSVSKPAAPLMQKTLQFMKKLRH